MNELNDYYPALPCICTEHSCICISGEECEYGDEYRLKCTDCGEETGIGRQIEYYLCPDCDWDRDGRECNFLHTDLFDDYER